MAEIKYQHPLDYYTVDNFIEETRKMIGKPVHGIMDTPSFEAAEHYVIKMYATALGDLNPLYNDLVYAADRTRYGTAIAPPTILILFKYPIYEGTLYDGPYPLVGLEAGFEWEWNDVIHMTDRFTTELVLKDVYEKPSSKGRTVYLVSECKYFNALSKELVATCQGTYAAIARAESITAIPDAVKEGFRKYPVTDRKLYYSTDEEVTKIIKDIEGMVRRGSDPLYWEDVNVGNNLPQIVKGPLTVADLMDYQGMCLNSVAFPRFELAFRKWRSKPGFLRANTFTGWPYEIQMTDHLDPHLSESRGMPYIFAMGSLRAGFGAHLLSNWMGDDGFIRRLKMDVLEPYIYGDALWIKGKVVDKYKEKLNGVLYGAVDIKIETVNQLGQNVAPGTATVYLPIPPQYNPPKLPLPL